jgi:hypothetical protein
MWQTASVRGEQGEDGDLDTSTHGDMQWTASSTLFYDTPFAGATQLHAVSQRAVLFYNHRFTSDAADSLFHQDVHSWLNMW